MTTGATRHPFPHSSTSPFLLVSDSQVSSMDKEAHEIVIKESDIKRVRQENVVNGWEKLNSDILLRIIQKNLSIVEFSKSGLAHVCRDWLAVCCDPVLWTTLDLSNMRSAFFLTGLAQPSAVYVMPSSNEELGRVLKLSMRLSKGNIRTLICHFELFLSNEMLTYTVKRCPNLRRLVLPAWGRLKETTISNALSYWKHLESLTMPSVPNPHYVFSSIVKKRKFRELKVIGPVHLFFTQNLVQHLPKLKVLSLRCTAIDRDALLKILDKLKSLEILNISHSYFVVINDQQEKIMVRELDEVIMEKASKLKSFVTCMEYQVCARCQWTEQNKGVMHWNAVGYPEGLWKEDEVNSLHL